MLRPLYKAMIRVGRKKEAWVWYNTNKDKYSDLTKEKLKKLFSKKTT